MPLTVNLEEDIIYIQGNIDESMVVPVLNFKELYLKKVENLIEKPTITVHVNTPGGCAFTCFTIVDILEELTEITTVNTKASGWCMSAGIPIWLIGNKREASKRTSFMIHEVSDITAGTVTGIKNNLDFLEELNRRYQSVITNRTKITKRTLKSYADKNKDYYLDAETMLSLLKPTEEELKE